MSISKKFPRKTFKLQTSRQELGSEGEKRVAEWYEENGYFLVDRNWRCAEGEIDLVVRRDRTVVFCEVKTRSSNAFGEPVEAVTEAKKFKVRKAATRWLTENGAPLKGELRFDFASVMGGEINIIENAF